MTTFFPTPVLLNFTMNDHHTGPTWNVLMWTLLFLGQGIQVSLYCQEWYARRHCLLPQKLPSPLLHQEFQSRVRVSVWPGGMGSPTLDIQHGSPEAFSFTFHPSLAQTTFWDLVTPWSWSCHP